MTGLVLIRSLEYETFKAFATQRFMDVWIRIETGKGRPEKKEGPGD